MLSSGAPDSSEGQCRFSIHGDLRGKPLEHSHSLLLFLFPSCSTPVGLDTQVDSRIPPQCSAGSPVTLHDRNRQRKGGSPETTTSICHLAKGSPWAWAVPGHRAGGQGPGAEGKPLNRGLGRGLWWQLQDVDIILIWGSWLLHHVPNHPLESGGPCRSLPKQTVTGFPLSGKGQEAVCLINHF